MVRALGGHLLSPEQDGEVPHSDSGEEGAAEATARGDTVWGQGREQGHVFRGTIMQASEQDSLYQVRAVRAGTVARFQLYSKDGANEICRWIRRGC